MCSTQLMATPIRTDSQVIENARRKSVEGLSLPFLANWFMGNFHSNRYGSDTDSIASGCRRLYESIRVYPHKPAAVSSKMTSLTP